MDKDTQIADQNNHILQEEGRSLLADIGLDKLLESFGEPVLGGSFVYGTMVDRDIDYAVIVEPAKFIPEFKADVLRSFADIPGLKKIELCSRFIKVSGYTPPGFWAGLTIIFNDNEWNIDIWYVIQDEPDIHFNLDLHKQMLHITEAQRLEMLRRKHELIKSGQKEKGISSAEIYFEVLESKS